MTAKQDNNKNKSNVNPFAAGTALCQNLITYSLNAFMKNSLKMLRK